MIQQFTLFPCRHRKGSNISYDNHSEPATQESFVNPVFQFMELEMNNEIDQSSDNVFASGSEDPDTALYDKVDEDGLPC
jgi:hypothetical protein